MSGVAANGVENAAAEAGCRVRESRESRESRASSSSSSSSSSRQRAPPPVAETATEAEELYDN